MSTRAGTIKTEQDGSIHKGKWAILSEKIKASSPLRGAGEFVRACSKELGYDNHWNKKLL